MRMLETAQGKFSNAWVAVYRAAGDATYYGFGITEDEAKQELLTRIPMDHLVEAMEVLTTRETYRIGHAARP